MMIAIKDMDMPKRCAECKICVNQKTNDYGTYGKCLLQNKSVDCLVWSRDANCTLEERENTTLMEIDKIRDRVLHSAEIYEPNDVLDIIDEITIIIRSEEKE